MNKTRWFLIALISTLIGFSNAYSQEGLIAFYSFNGNANDNSIFQNHGTIYGASLAEDLQGNPDQAYRFNGEDSYITMGDPETLKVDTAITISVWFKAEGPGTPVGGGILVNKEGEYELTRFADGSIRYAFAFNDFWDNHVNTNVYVPLNEPAHVAITYSLSRQIINLYLNCELVYSESANLEIGDFIPSQNEFRVGGRQYQAQFFDGIIDEVKVFNKALEEKDLLTLCAITNTYDNFSVEKIEIFPKLFTNKVFIKTELNPLFLNVYTLDGKLIKTEKLENGAIDLSQLGSGIYILSLFDQNYKFIRSEKLIKLRQRA